MTLARRLEPGTPIPPWWGIAWHEPDQMGGFVALVLPMPLNVLAHVLRRLRDRARLPGLTRDEERRILAGRVRAMAERLTVYEQERAANRVLLLRSAGLLGQIAHRTSGIQSGVRHLASGLAGEIAAAGIRPPEPPAS